MTKRRKITRILISSIIVVGAYFFFMTTGAELKKKWFGRLPTDIDRLKVTAVYPRDDPNAQKVYFEYASLSLYRELDALLKFRPVKRFVESNHSCLGEAMIYFYRGDELCQVRWNFAHDDFFHPGLLTAKSKKNLIKWFESKGFAMFSKGHVEWEALRAESDVNMVVD